MSNLSRKVLALFVERVTTFISSSLYVNAYANLKVFGWHIFPLFSMIPLVSSAAVRLMSTEKTFAPPHTDNTEVALPFPHPGPTEPAPVIIPTLFFRRPVIFHISSAVISRKTKRNGAEMIVLSCQMDRDHSCYCPHHISSYFRSVR